MYDSVQILNGWKRSHSCKIRQSCRQLDWTTDFTCQSKFHLYISIYTEVTPRSLHWDLMQQDGEPKWELQCSLEGFGLMTSDLFAYSGWKEKHTYFQTWRNTWISTDVWICTNTTTPTFPRRWMNKRGGSVFAWLQGDGNITGIFGQVNSFVGYCLFWNTGQNWETECMWTSISVATIIHAKANLYYSQAIMLNPHYKPH